MNLFSKKTSLIIACCILIININILYAETIFTNYIKTNWSSTQGLVSDTVKDILQDKHGYILIGTYDGLVRFDGVNFDVTNKYSLPEYKSISARVLLEDKQGNLWVGTNGDGVVKMKKDIVTMFTTKNDLPDNSIRSISEDNEGRIWIGTTNGICYIKEDKICKINSSESFSNNILIEFVYCDGDGKIFLAPSTGGLYEFDKESFVLSNNVSSKLVYTKMFKDKDGGYWLGTKEKGLLYIIEGIITTYNKSNGFNSDKVNSIMQDSQLRFWFGTDNGVIVRHNDKFVDYSEEDGLINDLVEKIYEDRESNIWIVTARGGIQKMSLSKFKSFGTKDGLVHQTVNSIAEDKNGYIWIGTDSGLSCLRDEIFHKNKQTDFFDGLRIRDVTIEGSLMMVSTYSSKGFVTYNGEAFRQYTLKEGLTGNRVRTSLKSKLGIWVATTNGLNLIKADGTIKNYTHDDGLSNDYIMCLYENKEGLLFMGTDGGGINVLNPKTDSFTYIKEEDGLAGNVIFKIYSDTDSLLWVSTAGGMSRIDQSIITNFNIGNGLKADSIFQVIEDHEKKMWMISNNSVFFAKKFDLNALAKKGLDRVSIRDFDKNDGLISSITSVSKSMIDQSGNIWFATLDGVVFIDPMRIKTNMHPPLIAINSVYLDDVKTKFDKSVIIKPGTKRLLINYSGLSFMIPERVNFRYKLEGFDKDFCAATNTRYTSYTNLPPGKYAFKLKAANNDGVWSDEISMISFVQKPFLFQRPSFYILLLLFIGLNLYFLYSIRVRILRRRQVELEILIKKRTEDLSIEKEKSESLLLNILPVPIAKRLKNGETSIVDKHESATILFADIVNFSTLCAETSPATLLYYLNTLFSAFDTLSVDMGLEKIKTIGDAYMVVSGLPEENSSHLETMIHYALKLFDTLEEVNGLIGINLNMRVGISTGPVVAGVIGTKKFIYDLWGDPVNIASRMEQLGKGGKIHVCSQVYEKTKHLFSYENRGEVDVKGVGLMNTYFYSGKL